MFYNVAGLADWGGGLLYANSSCCLHFFFRRLFAFALQHSPAPPLSVRCCCGHRCPLERGKLSTLALAQSKTKYNIINVSVIVNELNRCFRRKGPNNLLLCSDSDVLLVSVRKIKKRISDGLTKLIFSAQHARPSIFIRFIVSCVQFIIDLKTK